MAKKRHPPRKGTGNKGDIGRAAARLAADRDAAAAVEDDYLGAYRGVMGRRQLPASLRNVSEDDQVPVIITTRGDEPPEGAVELLGELNQDMTTEGSGFPLPAGSKVWLDSREGSLGQRAAAHRAVGEPDRILLPEADAQIVRPVHASRTVTRLPRGLDMPGSPERAARRRQLAEGLPAAFVRDPAAFAAALEAQQPGLTQRLAQGLSPDELGDPGTLQAIADAARGQGPGRYSVVQGAAAEPGRVHERAGGPGIIVTDDLNAIDTSDTDLVIEDLDPDDPDDSGRVMVGSPAQVKAYHARTEAADKRAARLIPGTRDTSALARTREAADAIGLRENWTAKDVLLAHEWLAKHYQDPHDEISDYLAFHMRNSLEQDHRTAAGFWPVDLRHGADIPEGARLARLVARGLGAARTYQVTGKMCRAMRAAWDAEPGQVLALDEGWLPHPAGFAWLDAPWMMELSAGYWLPVRAVSWERIVTLAKSTAGLQGLMAGDPGRPLDAVRTVLWLRIPDDVAFGRWQGQEKRALKVANVVGNVVPQQVTILPFGVRVNTEGEFHTNGKSLLGLLHTLWRTLGETLPRSRPVRIEAGLPGGPRQAARRTLRHTDVHVITLREYSYDSDPERHFPQSRDWTCRWWVDPFWRHVRRDTAWEEANIETDEDGKRRRHPAVPDATGEHCAVCGAKISHVGTFAKGPSGLPFRTPSRERTVWRLAR
jgi:hypothetical protein